MASFSQMIIAHKKKAMKSMDTVVVEMIQRANYLIVMRTPIDKTEPEHQGTARGGWGANIGSRKPVHNIDVSGSSTISNADAIAKNAFGKVYFLANAEPYIGVLEYGGYPNPPKNPTGRTKGGFSTQAPQGMLRISVAQITDEFNILVAKERRKY